ncbi:hypothetical protein [Nocardia sp. CA-135398]|uniref:tetratricopeptide repeat protein n=1 Tax=Nocardia sp. CA-135398 TaxID=3239977 RepID=UPI003D963CF0
MNQPYSHWYAQNSPENLPLAARYQSADPITWNGSLIYPMYTEQVGPAPILVTMKLLSAAPPAGLRGHGMGLSVVDGHIGIDGRRLAGVDVWSDALATGVTFEVVPTEPGALFSLTPVWVDGFGAQKSWSGNYGILIEQPRTGRIVLWCSVGEGPPNFANLVVEVDTASAPAAAVPAPAAAAPEPAPQPSQPAEPRQDRSGQPTPPTRPQRTVPVAPEQTRLPESQPTPAQRTVPVAPEQTRLPESQPTPAQRTVPVAPEQTRHPEPQPTPAQRTVPVAPEQTRHPEPQPTPTQRTVPVAPEQTRLPEPQPIPPDLEFVRFPEPLETAFARPELPAAEQTTPLQPARTRLEEPSHAAQVPERAADSDHIPLPDPPKSEQPKSQQRAKDGERGYRAALYDLGVAMFGRGEEEQACGLWAQAAEAGHAGAAYDLGVVLFNRGELGDAERWWRTAADRRESRAMTGLAELLERQGNHAEAQMWRACAAEEKTDEHDRSVTSG